MWWWIEPLFLIGVATSIIAYLFLVFCGDKFHDERCVDAILLILISPLIISMIGAGVNVIWSIWTLSKLM